MALVRFLERETQLAALRGYATEASAGSGRLVLVEGEAGVGKSTLLEHLEDDLPASTWWWGACEGLTTPRPLGPLHDIAPDVGGELDRARRAGEGRDELFAALVHELRAASDLVVLVVEDLHWADEATLDLVRHLARRVHRMRVLVLVSLRDDSAAASALRVALGDLARQRGTRRVTLPPLSLDAVSALVAGTSLDPSTVHRLTAGNPYFVAELLKARGDHLPSSARDSVLARLAMLSPSGQDLAEAAALAGPRVDRALITAVTGAGPADWDELVGAALLTTEGRNPRFRHELVRLAVADAVPPHRALELHRRLLDALVDQGCTDHSALAHHAEAAGDGEAVLRHASAAARAARDVGAHREAAAHFARALEGAVEPRTRATLHDALARELGLVDRWEEAQHHAVEAVRQWRSSDEPLRVGDGLRWVSQCLWRLSRGAESEEIGLEALACLEPHGDTPELARAVKLRAGTLMVTGRHQEAMEVAERAVALAERLDLADVHSDALDTLACCQAPAGVPWERTMQRALDVALEAGCAEQAGRAYVNFYSQYVDLLRPQDGERVFLDGLAYTEENDAATFANCILSTRVEALEAMGRWDEALALGRDRVGRTTMSPINALHFGQGTVRIRVRRGDESVVADLERTVAVALSTGEPQWTVPLLLTRAEWHWLRGSAADAALDAQAALAQATSSRLRGMAAVWARRVGVDVVLDPASCAAPWSDVLRGDVGAAARRWDQVGTSYDGALALLDGSDPEGWLVALGRLDALGAAPAAAMTRRRLRTAGVRRIPQGPRGSTRDNPFGLTAREQEVLAHVCDGLTNDEIARALFISPKTTEHHVSAVLAKLGVSNRRQVAAAIVPPGTRT